MGRHRKVGRPSKKNSHARAKYRYTKGANAMNREWRKARGIKRKR